MTTVLVAFILVFSITGFVIYYQVKQEITNSTQQENDILAKELSSQVQDSINQRMAISRTLAQTMEADLKGPRTLTREGVLVILRQILDANPNILGTYVGFEPNAFDGLDSKYKNTAGHDATGRFIPYINRLTGKVTLDPLLDYDKEGAGDYYILPKKTGKPCLIEPYLYQGVLMASLVVPIKDGNGKFLGIAGVDVGLQDLDAMISKIKILQSGNAYLVSNKGIYVSSPNKLMIGYSTLDNLNAKGIRDAFAAKTGFAVANPAEADVKSIEQMENGLTPEVQQMYRNLASEISDGKSGMDNIVDQLSGQEHWIFYKPVVVSGTDTPWSLLVNVPPDEALSPLAGILKGLVIISLGGIIIITLFLVWTARRIARPIALTAGMLQDIAEGEGDLTKRIQISANDEVGDLARWFNTFIEKLAELIKQVAESVREVETGSAQLAEAVEQQATAANQVTTAISQVAKGTQEQSQGVTSIQESISQLSSAITQIAKGAQDQAASIERTSELSIAMVDNVNEAVSMIKDIGDATKTNAGQAARGNEAVKAVVGSMGNIKSGADRALASAAELNNGSTKIGAIIEVINDIADQTNLLALNAAIEAARAGEHGKGFAVVADEVRKLAEMAKDSTGEISEIIKGLAVAIDSTIQAVQSSGKQVEEGTSLAGEAGQLLQEIQQTASHTFDGITSLLGIAEKLESRSKEVGSGMTSLAAVAEQNSASVEEMTASSDQVVNIIENIAAVSEENASSSEEVASVTEEQSAMVEEMSASATSLANSAVKLKELISRFKTE